MGERLDGGVSFPAGTSMAGKIESHGVEPRSSKGLELGKPDRVVPAGAVHEDGGGLVAPARIVENIVVGFPLDAGLRHVSPSERSRYRCLSRTSLREALG